MRSNLLPRVKVWTLLAVYCDPQGPCTAHYSRRAAQEVEAKANAPPRRLKYIMQSVLKLIVTFIMSLRRYMPLVPTSLHGMCSIILLSRFQLMSLTAMQPRGMSSSGGATYINLPRTETRFRGSPLVLIPSAAGSTIHAPFLSHSFSLLSLLLPLLHFFNEK